MKVKEFDRHAKTLFGATLSKYGFESTQSKHCTFVRELPGDVFHFVMPDPGTRGVWFDVKVFATSPVLDPLFRQHFPDYLGIPADSYCYLNKRSGVGPHQQTFEFDTAQRLESVCAQQVAPLLLEKALTYLDAIRSIQDLLPLIRHKMFRATALSYLGDPAAVPLLVEQIGRLKEIAQSNPGEPEVPIVLAHFQQLLGRESSKRLW